VDGHFEGVTGGRLGIRGLSGSNCDVTDGRGGGSVSPLVIEIGKRILPNGFNKKKRSRDLAVMQALDCADLNGSFFFKTQ